jgi:guanine deaminase
MTNTTIRGAALLPDPLNPIFAYHPDVVLCVENGVITDIRTDVPANTSVDIHYQNSVILPGFIDSHLHFPQTQIIGSASGPLLPWLKDSVFPEEARFESDAYSRNVARIFCNRMLENGTVGAAIYSSSHHNATEILTEQLVESGLKSIVGMTLMDIGAPDNLVKDQAYVKDNVVRMVEKWNGFDSDRIQYCITPRFALACSEGMLNLAGRLSEEYKLWVQTHVSENTDEVKFARELHPNSSDYLGIYENAGMLHSKSIYAHCIYLSESEWGRLVDSEAVVAHCADSNFFLGSGCMPLANALDIGAKVTMGTDVGAGRSFSVRVTASRSYDASLICNRPVSPETLLYLSTSAGHRHLKLGGGLDIGADADFVVIRTPEFENKAMLINHILFNQDITTVEATYIRGVLRYSLVSS